VGFTIRTAEVAGASGVVVTGEHGRDARSRASHVSMGADRLLPVIWQADRASVLDALRESGSTLVGIEDVGEKAPWEVDLKGPVVLLAGNERSGLDPELLARCDRVVRVPMAGFVPSYNLQAAISAVASERLRQLTAQS
jgi:TrmH family RNA methyltransferase